MKLFSRLILINCFLFVGPLVFGFTFKHADSRLLAQHLDASFQRLSELQANAPHSDVALQKLNVAQIEQEFLKLPRLVPIEDIVELKYAMSHWREAVEAVVVNYLEKQVVATAPIPEEKLSQFLVAVKALNQLQTLVLDDTLDRLTRWAQPFEKGVGLEIAKEVALLIAIHGDPTLRPRAAFPSTKYKYLSQLKSLPEDFKKSVRLIAGPMMDRGEGGPSMVPIDPSSQDDFANWSQKPEFSDYEFSKENPDEPIYRNVQFKSGDFVAIEQAIEVDTAINTSFSDPRSLFSHMGMYVTLHDRHHRRFPAIIEISKNTLRAIPLSTYLSPVFTHYSEVYRPDRPGFSEKVEAVALKKTGEVFRYDFFAKELNAQSPNCVNCSNMGSLFLTLCGYEPISERSAVSEGILPTLKMMGLDFTKYLTPTDYRKSSDLKTTGILDNHNTAKMLSRELVVGSESVPGTVGFLLSHRKVEEEKLPDVYRGLLKTANQIKNKGFGYKLALSGLGFTEANFPDAPPKALAYVIGLGIFTKKAIWGTYQSIRKEDGQGMQFVHEQMNRVHRFSVHDVERDPRVRHDIAGKFDEIEKWFAAP